MSLRRLVAIGALGVVAVGVPIVASCKKNDEISCAVDTDCPTGNICRSGVCGIIDTDASSSPEGSTPPVACLDENAVCQINTDCCSQICDPTSIRCTASTSPTPSATCKGQFELCQGDCCENLTCTNGACK